MTKIIVFRLIYIRINQGKDRKGEFPEEEDAEVKEEDSETSEDAVVGETLTEVTK